MLWPIFHPRVFWRAVVYACFAVKMKGLTFKYEQQPQYTNEELFEVDRFVPDLFVTRPTLTAESTDENMYLESSVETEVAEAFLRAHPVATFICRVIVH